MTSRKWTRTGCLTCKRRRKKCDETQPWCQNCERLGLSCGGYASIWAAPALPRRRNLGQVLPAPRKPLPIDSMESDSPWQMTLSSPLLSKYIQTSPGTSTIASARSLHVQGIEKESDDDEFHQVSSDGSFDAALAFPSSSTAPTSDPFHIPTTQRLLIRYYVDCASDRLINLEIANNPLRTLILPRAWLSTGLLNAVCAVSAAHWSNTFRKTQMEVPSTSAVLYYRRSLRDLNASLDKFARVLAGNGTQLLIPTDVILTTAMLCKYEIISGSIKNWMPHLNGLRKMIAQRGGFESLEHDIRDFLQGLYGYHHNLSRVANLSTVADKTTQGMVTPLHNQRVDVYFGLTGQLGHLCSSIWELSRLIPGTISDMENLWHKVTRINIELSTWTCPMTRQELPCGISVEAFLRLEKVANSFRYAAFIYLHSVLAYIALKSPVIWSGLPALQHRELSYSKERAVELVLEIIRDCLPLKHCEYSALCFALFCVGMETEFGDDRLFVLHCIEELEAAFGIGNTSRLKMLIQYISKIKVVDGVRKHWQFAMEELGWELCLT